jgi:hypothetical protein
MVLLEVLFCLYAVTMLARYLPLLRGALSRDPERRPDRAAIVVINVILALGILVAVLLAVVVKGRWGGLISR